MNKRNCQRIPRSTSMLVIVLVAGGLACDSGKKQIGSLDGAEATETNDDDDPGDDDPDSEGESAETGEGCTQFEATECMPQVSNVIEAAVVDEEQIEQDLLLHCAANVEPITDGYRVTMTHCSDLQGQPQIDHELNLVGSWPEPELTDGDQPLTEVRYVLDDDGFGASWVILRSLDHQRVKLLVFKDTKLEIDPGYILPLWLSVDEAACGPGPLPCTPETQFQEFPVGFSVGYGCAFGTVGHDTMLTDFGIDEGTGTAYDVLAGFAVTHECYEDGDFQELQLGIVGFTP
jgi:hypothetical protein